MSAIFFPLRIWHSHNSGLVPFNLVELIEQKTMRFAILALILSIGLSVLAAPVGTFQAQSLMFF